MVVDNNFSDQWRLSLIHGHLLCNDNLNAMENSFVFVTYDSQELIN